MFLLFGFKSKLAELAAFVRRCGFCGQTAVQRLLRSQRYFTLFFIPVLPLGAKHLLACDNCGNASRVSNRDVPQLVAEAQGAAAPAAAGDDRFAGYWAGRQQAPDDAQRGYRDGGNGHQGYGGFGPDAGQPSYGVPLAGPDGAPLHVPSVRLDRPGGR